MVIMKLIDIVCLTYGFTWKGDTAAQGDLSYARKANELQQLKDQLATNKAAAAKKDMGKKVNEPAQGLSLLMAARNAAHTPANVGHWQRTNRSSKWTKANVAELIGALPYGKLAQWYAFSAIYAAEYVTENLKSAFLKESVDECVKALQEQKLAMADLQDMRDPQKTGDLTNISE